MAHLPLNRKPYFLWIDYGSEGWSLSQTADTPEELLERVRCGDSYGNEWVITKEINFAPVEYNICLKKKTE